MKAMIYTAYGAPEVLHLHEVEQPIPKEDEVLIKLHATSVTTGDCNGRNFVFVPKGLKFLARLMLGISKPKKPILGLEFAGEIVGIGAKVSHFKIGDRVFGLDGIRFGAYAQYKSIADHKGVVQIPPHMPYEEAVAIPNGALTALTFLRNKGKVQSGHKVLINGASGSVGIAAVQIAKSYGAQVTAVCSDANQELVKSFGADRVIDYTRENFTQQNETYDLILDVVAQVLSPSANPSSAHTGAI